MQRSGLWWGTAGCREDKWGAGRVLWGAVRCEGAHNVVHWDALGCTGVHWGAAEPSQPPALAGLPLPPPILPWAAPAPGAAAGPHGNEGANAKAPRGHFHAGGPGPRRRYLGCRRHLPAPPPSPPAPRRAPLILPHTCPPPAAEAPPAPSIGGGAGAAAPLAGGGAGGAGTEMGQKQAILAFPPQRRPRTQRGRAAVPGSPRSGGAGALVLPHNPGSSGRGAGTPPRAPRAGPRVARPCPAAAPIRPRRDQLRAHGL